MTNTRSSTTVGEIAKALCKAQAELLAVKKDKQGYGYKYADLASCLEAIREPFSKNGLAISQLPQPSDGNSLVLDTLLLHESGEYIVSSITVMIPKPEQETGDRSKKARLNPCQAMGSALTYARRYALAAIVGLAQEDDDAAGAYPSVVKVEKDDSCEVLTKLKELCRQENISVKAFASYFGLNQSNMEKIKQAVEDFRMMAKVFKSVMQDETAREAIAA